MMFDLNSPVQWQIRDEKYPTFMPWYTHGMLDALKKMDLSDKVVLEWGGGWSSIYYAFYSKFVFIIESNLDYVVAIHDYAKKWGLLDKICIIHREVNEGDQTMVDFYTAMPEECYPDVVVVDSVLRHECLAKALTLHRPLIIIHDNWQQDGFVCPASEELMAPYEIHNFIQEDHTDNHGRKWATAYWELK